MLATPPRQHRGRVIFRSRYWAACRPRHMRTPAMLTVRPRCRRSLASWIARGSRFFSCEAALWPDRQRLWPALCGRSWPLARTRISLYDCTNEF